MRWRERIDRFPTHKWMSRLVIPVFVTQRTTKIVDNDTFDTLLIVYLWWLSEVTEHDSWQARRQVEQTAESGGLT